MRRHPLRAVAAVVLLAGAQAVAIAVSLAACTDETLTPRAAPLPPADFPESGAEGDARASGDGGVPGVEGGGAPSREGLLRVATFNVRRYFDTVCDTGRCTATDFEGLPSQTELDNKTTRLANGLVLIDADVIALEEVENTRCLDLLVAKLASLGKPYPLAHLGETNAPGSIDVAVLARGALTSVKTHRQTPIPIPGGGTTTFARELLEVHMTFGVKSVVMFAAHFRSKVDDDPDRRLAESTAAREIVSKAAAAEPAAVVILGGDLNDTPGSPPIDALEQGGLLVRVASDLTVADQATYTFQGQKQAIDHLFVSKGQAARYVAKSATPYRDDPSRTGFASSDHSPLAADFDLK